MKMINLRFLSLVLAIAFLGACNPQEEPVDDIEVDASCAKNANVYFTGSIFGEQVCWNEEEGAEIFSGSSAVTTENPKHSDKSIGVSLKTSSGAFKLVLNHRFFNTDKYSLQDLAEIYTPGKKAFVVEGDEDHENGFWLTYTSFDGDYKAVNQYTTEGEQSSGLIEIVDSKIVEDTDDVFKMEIKFKVSCKLYDGGGNEAGNVSGEFKTFSIDLKK